MAETIKYLDLNGLARYNELLHNEIEGKTHTVTVNSGKKADGTTDITATSVAAVNPTITLANSGVTAGEYGPTTNQTPAYGATFNVPDIKVNAQGIVTSVVNRTVQIPASEASDTASAVDNILDGSNEGTAITYAPYTTQQNKLSFDTSNTNPIGTDRLNLNGKFYATEVYSEGAKVITSHQDISGLAPKASPEFTGTPTAPTAAAGTNTTQIATTAFVQTAISGITDAMVFIGSIGEANGSGTISAIPTANVKVGHTYKIVDEDKTIAAANSATGAIVTAKVGDTIVATDVTPKWVVIPSGDEPSGTVTSIAIANGDGITVSGGPITTSGTFTVTHADTSSQASVTNSGRTYIQSITLDGMGHVTAISSGTETSADTNQKVKAGNVTFGDDDVINIKAGTGITVTGDATNKEITIAGSTYSSLEAANAGTDLSLVTTGEKYIWNNKQDALAAQTAYSAQGSATKVPKITTNSLGQVTNIEEVTITQPTVNDSSFAIKTKVGANNAVTAADFTANQGTDDDLTIVQGDNITLTTDAVNRTITIAATQPTVNNGTLTIQGDSNTAASFSANQSGSTSVNFVGSNGISVVGTTGTVTIGLSNISYGTGELDSTKDIDKLFI